MALFEFLVELITNICIYIAEKLYSIARGNNDTSKYDDYFYDSDNSDDKDFDDN